MRTPDNINLNSSPKTHYCQCEKYHEVLAYDFEAGDETCRAVFRCHKYTTNVNSEETEGKVEAGRLLQDHCSESDSSKHADEAPVGQRLALTMIIFCQDDDENLSYKPFGGRYRSNHTYQNTPPALPALHSNGFFRVLLP